MIRLIRTNSDNADFRELVKLLDEILKKSDGDEHSFFAKYNKLDSIKHVVIAYYDEMPAGCGAIKTYTKDTAEIKRMFVVKEFRRQGIAGLILKELELWGSELNFSYCILETGRKLTEAVVFYKSQGYKETANYGQYIGKKQSICMRKNMSL